jgi:hypothetical protein
MTVNAGKLLNALTTALVFTLCTAGAAIATPLEDLRQASVSELEMGSLRMEIALSAIKDWPAPIEGASVTYAIDPDQLQILVALKKPRSEDAQSLCARTLGRIREMLYVKADGTLQTGRSSLNTYFRVRWQGSAREAALHSLDMATSIRVDVAGAGTCRAPLVKGAIKFEPVSTK